MCDADSESIRLFRRYAVEIVESLGLCPWAKRARESGRVREIVLHELDEARTQAAIEPLSNDPEVEIGIVLFPCAEIDRAGFERFVARVRTLDEGGPFAMAEFHPDAPAKLDPPGAFTSFLRRTPDPTIQLVRKSALERVRGSRHGGSFVDFTRIDLAAWVAEASVQPLHEQVAAHNREIVARLGLHEVSSRLDEIRKDRDETYARLTPKACSRR